MYFQLVRFNVFPYSFTLICISHCVCVTGEHSEVHNEARRSVQGCQKRSQGHGQPLTVQVRTCTLLLFSFTLFRFLHVLASLFIAFFPSLLSPPPSTTQFYFPLHFFSPSSLSFFCFLSVHNSSLFLFFTMKENGSSITVY